MSSPATTRRPHARWGVEEIRAELSAFVARLAAGDASKAGWMPTDGDFNSVPGGHALLTAVQRSGGREYWSGQCGLRLRPMGRPPLHTPDSVEAKLRELHVGQTRFHTFRWFRENNLAPLYHGAQRLAPIEEWAAIIGVSPPGRGRPRATD